VVRQTFTEYRGCYLEVPSYYFQPAYIGGYQGYDTEMSWPLVQNMAILTKKEKKSFSCLMVQPLNNSIFALIGKRCRWHFILSYLGYIVDIGPYTR